MAKSLAVKYRPKNLKDVVGQPDTVKILKNVLLKAHKNEEYPAGFLITGDTGLGKTTISRIIARYLNCNLGNGCGECISCKNFDENAELHQDFYEENSANARGIDDIRSMIDMAKYAPMYKCRVILLDEAHQLTSQASQALLKTLEEPPPATSFIISTTNPEKLPRAMGNRCIKLHLNPVDTKELAKRLYYISKKEKFDISKDSLLKIAEYSGGMVRESIAVLERLSVLSGGGNYSKKQIEESFFSLDRDDISVSASRILIGLYEKSTSQILIGLSEVKDFNQLLSKLIFMNGYAIYTILKMYRKDIKNPYYATPENRNLFNAIYPDIKKDPKSYLKQCMETTKKLVELQNKIHQSNIDIRTVAISVLV